MDPWAPINGISLERYAELSAEVEGTQDPATQSEIVGKLGVQRADWEAAKAGWTARMQDMSLMGQVATRFMPLYQGALARKAGGVPRVGAHAQPNPYAHPYPPQASYNAQAQSVGAQMGSAWGAFSNALGSFVDGAIGAFSTGSRVMVQWSDGNRYPGTVTNAQGAQVEVMFPDGRRVWVHRGYVSTVY